MANLTQHNTRTTGQNNPRWPFAPICIALLLASGCGSNPAQDPTLKLTARIDSALESATHYLLSTQSKDGAWRSSVYGFFKDGPSLTPHVLNTMFLLNATPDTRQSFASGCGYLRGLVGRDGAVDGGDSGLTYPAYTAASSVRVLALENNPDHAAAARSYLALLRSHQFNEALGWQPTDLEYGGWSYATRTPRRPTQLTAHFDANLSATLYAVTAMRIAGVAKDDPAWKQALTFVQRCQNFSEGARNAQFDDGGFFLTPCVPLLNKAGAAGIDRAGRERFHSYASITADGLRALLDCGLPMNHPRVVAARAWLERNFSAFTNAGVFSPDRDRTRNATYYYYAWSVASALQQLGVREVQTRHGKVNWAKDLSQALIDRQRPDGSWANEQSDGKEDDPLVATPFAATALKICQRSTPAE